MRAVVISLSGRIATVRPDGYTYNIQASLIKSVVSGDVVANAIAVISGNERSGYILIGIIG